jgi:hypothetical protein
MQRVGIFIWLSLALVTSTASAEVLSFTIDSQQSYLQMAVTIPSSTTPISTPQTPGSDRTSVSGTFNIDVTPTSLQFLTTNNAHPANQAAPQAPLIDGSAGASPAQIGLSLDIPGILTGVAAIRNYVADVTGPVIPLAGTSFDSTQTSLSVSGGTTSFNLIVLGSPLIDSYMGGDPGLNLLSGGTLSLVGDTYTLVLPYLVNNPQEISGIEYGLSHSGVIVATAVVPEPSTWMLGVIGLVALVGKKWGRTRLHLKP